MIHVPFRKSSRDYTPFFPRHKSFTIQIMVQSFCSRKARRIVNSFAWQFLGHSVATLEPLPSFHCGSISRHCFCRSLVSSQKGKNLQGRADFQAMVSERLQLWPQKSLSLAKKCQIAVGAREQGSWSLVRLCSILSQANILEKFIKLWEASMTGTQFWNSATHFRRRWILWVGNSFAFICPRLWGFNCGQFMPKTIWPTVGSWHSHPHCLCAWQSKEVFPLPSPTLYLSLQSPFCSRLQDQDFYSVERFC